MTEWLRLYNESVLQDCRKADDLKVSIFDSVSGTHIALYFKFQLSTLARARQTSTEDQLIVELDKAKALSQTLALPRVTFKMNSFVDA